MVFICICYPFWFVLVCLNCVVVYICKCIVFCNVLRIERSSDGSQWVREVKKEMFSERRKERRTEVDKKKQRAREREGERERGRKSWREIERMQQQLKHTFANKLYWKCIDCNENATRVNIIYAISPGIGHNIKSNFKWKRSYGNEMFSHRMAEMCLMSCTCLEWQYAPISHIIVH